MGTYPRSAEASPVALPTSGAAASKNSSRDARAHGCNVASSSKIASSEIASRPRPQRLPLFYPRRADISRARHMPPHQSSASDAQPAVGRPGPCAPDNQLSRARTRRNHHADCSQCSGVAARSAGDPPAHDCATESRSPLSVPLADCPLQHPRANGRTYSPRDAAQHATDTPHLAKPRSIREARNRPTPRARR